MNVCVDTSNGPFLGPELLQDVASIFVVLNQELVKPAVTILEHFGQTQTFPHETYLELDEMRILPKVYTCTRSGRHCFQAGFLEDGAVVKYWQKSGSLLT